MKTSVSQISCYKMSWQHLATLSKKSIKKLVELAVTVNLKLWYQCQKMKKTQNVFFY